MTALFVLFWQWNNLSGVGGLCVLRATTKKGRQLFLRKKVHPDDLARKCSDLANNVSTKLFDLYKVHVL